MPRHIALALLAGGLLSAAFAPLNAWPAAIAGLALLLWLVHSGSVRRAVLLGWLAGFAHFLSGVWWVVISTHVYGGAPLWLALCMLVLLSAFLALFPALAVLVFRLCAPPGALGLALVWPAAWLFGEFARDAVLGGFPWFALGYLATEVPGALKLAPVLGVDGLSALFALSAAALVGLAVAPRWPVPAVAAAAWAVVLVLPAPQDWTRPSGEPLDVVLIQGNIPQGQKWQPQNLLPTMTLYQELTAAAWPADLVIWPEVAIPSRLSHVQDFFEAQAEAARAAGGTLFFTTLTYEDDRPYNTVYALGEGRGRYVKQHLVPFGEYIPTPDWMRPAFDLLDVPLPDIATGLPGDALLQVDGRAVSMSICFEDLFPLEVRRTSVDSDFLVNVTNDAWFEGSAAPAQHLQIARLRAAESGRSLLRAANTGISALIDANGGVVRQLSWGERGQLRGQVQPRRGETPFQRLGRWPHDLVLASALLGGLLRRRRLVR